MNAWTILGSAVVAVSVLPAAAHADELRVEFVELSTHGESILISTPGGKHVLVDAGLPPGGREVVRTLRRAGVTSLDLLVLTHDDPDHLGGLPTVLEAFPVKEHWESPVRPSGVRKLIRLPITRSLSKHRVPRREVLRGQRLELEQGVILEVLAPTRPWFTTPERDDVNADSLVLRLTYKGTRFLLTGDITKRSEERLLADGVDVSCDVLKVAHHGVDSASSQRFLDATGARVAVVCCAAGGGGLPQRAVLERLKQAGIDWYRTDRNGRVVVRTRGAGDLRVNVDRGAKNDSSQNPTAGPVALLRRYTGLGRSAAPVGSDSFVGMLGRRVYHRRTCAFGRLIPRGRAVGYPSRRTAEADGRSRCRFCLQPEKELFKIGRHLLLELD